MAEEKKPAAAKTAAAKPAAAKPATKAAAPKAAAKPATKAAAPKAAAPKAAAKPATKAAAPKAVAPKAAAEKAPVVAATKPAVAKSKKKPAAKIEKSQILRLHHLRPAKGAKKEKTRKGLGEGSKGKTAGRGTKGTGARTTTRLGFEGGGVNLVMRTPKLRGFKNPFRVEYQVVNLEKLTELYPKGGAVTISDLVAKGAVRKNKPVKVLGNGDLSVKLEISVDKVSESAKTKIEAAGGSVNA
jgi:large subunit ribosomal protein L15